MATGLRKNKGNKLKVVARVVDFLDLTFYISLTASPIRMICVVLGIFAYGKDEIRFHSLTTYNVSFYLISDGASPEARPVC